MPGQWIWAQRMVLAVGLLAVVAPATVTAQANNKVAAPVSDVAVPTAKQLGETQETLMSLLKVSPTLAQVVSADPSLLGNQEYVARSNPELEQFMQQHPEIARNPSFYLFSNLREDGQQRYEVLVPKAGFEKPEQPRPNDPTREILENMLGPFVVMVFIGGAFLWLIRTLLENRRWSRIFKLQGQVHEQLIAKFGSSDEVLAYMQTDAGKRFLEAAPIATELDQKRMPNVVSRVMTTVQVGVVLTLLGCGLMYLRRVMGPQAAGLLVLGVVVLMPGLGCIISAAMTWVIARRLGLLRDLLPEAISQEQL